MTRIRRVESTKILKVFLRSNIPNIKSDNNLLALTIRTVGAGYICLNDAEFSCHVKATVIDKIKLYACRCCFYLK